MPVLLWYIFGNFWYTILFGNFGDIEQIETFFLSYVVSDIDPSFDGMNTLQILTGYNREQM